MKHQFRFSKKAAVASLAVGLIMGAGGFAFAFFSSTGSGTGSAGVGKSATLQITQNGAVYDSLIPGNGYVQDQAFFSSINGFGNTVNLTAPGYLYDVVVAFRNWTCGPNPAIPVTLSLYTPGSFATPLATDTQNVTFAPPTGCSTPSFNPTVTNVTFFSNQPFVNYVGGSVAFVVTGLIGTSVNVALASSGTNLLVGTDTTPGTVLINPADSGQGFDADTGCSTVLTPNVIQQTTVWGCTTPANNYGAYGNASGADIPAIEFNMMSAGTTPPLFPGQSEPVYFTVTNTGSGPAMVNAVSAAVSSIVNANDNAACLAGNWFSFSGGNVSQEVAAGASVNGYLWVSMSDPNVNQDACQGATLNLALSSN